MEAEGDEQAIDLPLSPACGCLRLAVPCGLLSEQAGLPIKYCRLVTDAQIIDIAIRQVVSLVSPTFRAAYARLMVLCLLMRETQEVARHPHLSPIWPMNG